jgi:hypothetical protein
MAIIKNILTVSVPSIGKIPLADKPGSFMPSAEKREHKAGRQAEDGGFLKTSQAAKLDLSLNLLGGIDIDTLNAVDGETITIRLADGSVYMMPQAACTEPCSVTDGDSKIVFMANYSERIA